MLNQEQIIIQNKADSLNAVSIYVEIDPDSDEWPTLTFSRIWGDELASFQDYESGYDLTECTVLESLIDDQDRFVRLSEGIFQLGEDAELMDSVELV